MSAFTDTDAVTVILEDLQEPSRAGGTLSSPIEIAIFELLDTPSSGGAPPRSIAPEAVARQVGGEGWLRVLPQVRAAAVGLARQGRLHVLRHGKPADPETLKGVYRLGRPDAPG